jgi:hypothetical protein
MNREEYLRPEPPDRQALSYWRSLAARYTEYEKFLSLMVNSGNRVHTPSTLSQYREMVRERSIAIEAIEEVLREYASEKRRRSLLTEHFGARSELDSSIALLFSTEYRYFLFEENEFLLGAALLQFDAEAATPKNYKSVVERFHLAPLKQERVEWLAQFDAAFSRDKDSEVVRIIEEEGKVHFALRVFMEAAVEYNDIYLRLYSIEEKRKHTTPNKRNVQRLNEVWKQLSLLPELWMATIDSPATRVSLTETLRTVREELKRFRWTDGHARPQPASKEPELTTVEVTDLTGASSPPAHRLFLSTVVGEAVLRRESNGDERTLPLDGATVRRWSWCMDSELLIGPADTEGLFVAWPVREKQILTFVEGLVVPEGTVPNARPLNKEYELAILSGEAIREMASVRCVGLGSFARDPMNRARLLEVDLPNLPLNGEETLDEFRVLETADGRLVRRRPNCTLLSIGHGPDTTLILVATQDIPAQSELYYRESNEYWQLWWEANSSRLREDGYPSHPADWPSPQGSEEHRRDRARKLVEDMQDRARELQLKDWSKERNESLLDIELRTSVISTYSFMALA